MVGTTTTMALTGTEAAIDLFEILGILLPLVGVLMQVMIQVYLTEDHQLSYRRQITSLSFIILALVILILTGAGFLGHLIQQPATSSLTLPLIGFGVGLALVVLAVLWVAGDVIRIIVPSGTERQSENRGYPPAADPQLNNETGITDSENAIEPENGEPDLRNNGPPTQREGFSEE